MRAVLLSTLLAFTGLTVTAADAPGDTPDAKPKPYPLKTCIVSGEELGSMGKPVVKVHKGQEVKFCCKHCIKDFDSDPDGHVKKMQEAAEAAKNK